MTRQLVEGITHGVRHGLFDEENVAMLMVEAPPAGVIRDLTMGRDLLLARDGQLFNSEIAPNDHTFSWALVGADVPGGTLNLNPFMSTNLLVGTTVAAQFTGFAAPMMPLIGDQAVYATMGEALVNANLPVSFVNSWADIYRPNADLRVVREITGTKLALVNDSTPFVIDGPGDAFSTRQVLTQFAPVPSGTAIANQDTVDHVITVTLVDPDNGDTVLVNGITLPSGNHFQGLLPSIINLVGNQSLVYETATATVTDDPYVWAVYKDLV